ncbi:hypothetical protein Pint_24394 [Pistacia integerrima]|uniref:Uncharacterized protein n=1 Tax=Pistacia integerrima TaxID=434235 RepID=A0ACC0YEV7_9ROSI|nr:hypothetical protein Pint_24394 [Pistacia integerrima]
MRGFSSLASRATPSLKHISEESSSHKISNPKLKPSLVHKQTNNNTEASSRGNNSSSSLLNSRFLNKPNSVSYSNSLISANKRFQPIDHSYISQILARNDWFLLLNHELKAKRISLVPQFVVSILQNQENPLHPLRFYIWVSNIEPLFSKNQLVKSVLANVLYRKGPVILSVELLKDIKNSGFQLSEDLLCVLIGSWGRLGLSKYCAEIFGQISFLGISPSTRLYNAVIDALVKSNSIDLAYLKFQEMSVDNCKPDRFTYNILIHGVCRIGVVDEALRLVKQMEGVGYSPNVFTYTILIDGFCNAKRVDEAFRVLEMMKERKVSPNEATVRSLVHGVFRCSAPRKAFELLIMFMEREPVMPKLACDTLLYCLSNNSMAREAAMFLRKVGERGYLPESSTFNTTMTCLITGLNLDETSGIFKRRFVAAKEMFLSMEANGCIPDSYTSNLILETLIHNGCSEDACDIVKRYNERGCYAVCVCGIMYNHISITRYFKFLTKNSFMLPGRIWHSFLVGFMYQLLIWIKGYRLPGDKPLQQWVLLNLSCSRFYAMALLQAMDMNQQ